jgi:hypothetical protein
MNPILAYLLVHLYPRLWRDRYGAEFEAFLRAGRGDLHTLANVVWAAICERIMPVQGLKLNQNPCFSLFQSWCARVPWAMFVLAPLFLLAGAYFAACLYLWLGWTLFLPGADTPFGVHPKGPIYGFQNLYFQAGKCYYTFAPMLVGWVVGLAAARQKSKAVWPIAGLVIVALMGATARIQASRTAVPGSLGHIRMDFPLAHFVAGNFDGPLHALVIFSFTALPYLIWRIQRARSAPA